MVDLPANGVELNGLQIGFPQGGSAYVLSDLNVGGKPDTAVGDKSRPREDGLFFGRDLVTGRAIILEGSVSLDVDARDAYGALSTAWNARSTRLTPGAYLPLRLRMFNGPTRVVFGRPREFAPKDDPGLRLMDLGRVDFVAQFRCIDDLFYDDIEQSESVGISGVAVPGLKGPLKGPLIAQSADASTTDGRIAVGGTEPAWPSITFHGPVTNPMWLIPGLGYLQLAMTLAYDDFVTISTAPWARFVRLNGVTNAAGALTAQSLRLSKARLEPGVHQLVFRGVSDTGSAWLSTSWRDCFDSI